MRVIVMGAGLAGVTTAWFLARDGHQVTVVDREAGVAAAASRANAGIVAVSRPFPWPGPQMLDTFMKALGRNDQAIRLHWQWEPWFWVWSLRFLANCTLSRHLEIFGHKARLVRYSRDVLGRLVADTGIEYHRGTGGVLYLYADAMALARAWSKFEMTRHLGILTVRLTPEEVKRLEPGMYTSRLAGAILAPGDESGDSALFCRELAKRCNELGVRFLFNAEILGFEKNVQLKNQTLSADAYVCALGVIDPALRRKLGADVPIYPVKGYSTTGRIVRPELAPQRAGMDESNLIAYCPQGDRIRVTGGAEFAGYGKSGTQEDFARLQRAFDAIFPGAADFSAAENWVCQRPMTPESTPRFGRGRRPNLWFNVGQGHMGWAMAAGSAKITSDLVSGREPEISLDGLTISG
jgi:D-amino-acid dehydrogenase